MIGDELDKAEGDERDAAVKTEVEEEDTMSGLVMSINTARTGAEGERVYHRVQKPTATG